MRSVADEERQRVVLAMSWPPSRASVSASARARAASRRRCGCGVDEHADDPGDDEEHDQREQVLALVRW